MLDNFAILGIIIFIYVSVVHIPGRFRVIAQADGKIDSLNIFAKYSWMFRLVFVIIEYKEGVLRWKIRLLWESSEEVDNLFGSNSENESTNENGKSKKKTHKKTTKGIEKIRCTFRELYDSIKEMLNKKTELQKFLKEDTHIASLKILKDELFIFLKHCQLDVAKGYLRVGLDEPYHTGQLLAALSILYPFIGADLVVKPEFEQEDFDKEAFEMQCN